MGKSARSSSSRYGSERLLHHVSVGNGADLLAELDEEDVWSVLAAPTAETTRTKPDGRRGRWAAGGLSLAFEATPRHQHRHHVEEVGAVASSAPVKVPEWASCFPAPGGEQQYGYGYGTMSCREEEEAGEEWVAPHEYAQRRGGGTATASVLEGVGRKLKGRDLSRVREAVWSNTGFLG